MEALVVKALGVLLFGEEEFEELLLALFGHDKEEAFGKRGKREGLDNRVGAHAVEELIVGEPFCLLMRNMNRGKAEELGEVLREGIIGK